MGMPPAPLPLPALWFELLLLLELLSDEEDEDDDVDEVVYVVDPAVVAAETYRVVSILENMLP